MNSMNRAEAIATINAQLADADDATVEAVAGYVKNVIENQTIRPLSKRERGLLEQSRRDFENGDTLTLDEFMARTDALIARHRKTKATPCFVGSDSPRCDGN